jgi:hypothetical protein
MRGSSGANSGGGARARTCRTKLLYGIWTRHSRQQRARGASQSVRSDHRMNRRRDPLPPIEQHNGVCAWQ